MRRACVAVLLTAVAATGCGAVVAGPRPPGPPEAPHALRVLHAWDGRRAAAWSAGDVAALRRLYGPACSAGVADVALLRRYLARGFRVVGMTRQVVRVRVLVDRQTEVRVEVSDRLAGAVAVDRGGVRVRLPVTSVQRRIVDLRYDGTRWQVASIAGPVRDGSPRPGPR